jgi:hypothetical protein
MDEMGKIIINAHLPNRHDDSMSFLWVADEPRRNGGRDDAEAVIREFSWFRRGFGQGFTDGARRSRRVDRDE